MRLRAIATAVAIFLASALACAEEQKTAGACAAIEADAERLACYDSFFRNPQAQFGVEERAAPKGEIQEVRARVVGAVRRSRGEYELTLDNGQVWVQGEGKKELTFRAGDEVLIRRATLGSYRVQHVGRNTSTTVKRIR